jgi:endoglucanase
MDEIGLIVKYIDDQGFVYVQRVGGVDPALVMAKRVTIHGANGPVLGVVGSTPIHLQERGKERKVPKLHELYVDVGASSREEAQKRVAVGDLAVFNDTFEMLTEHIAVARAMDNRVGTWVAIEALRLAGEAGTKCAVYACSSVQEEVGLRGAEMQAFNVKPDAAVVLDVTFATDTPGIDVKQHGEVKLGEGPSINVGRENHPVLVERLRKVARKKKLPHQIEAFTVSGGTDAFTIYTKNGGIPCAGIGLPDRYMHSTVETLDLRDLENAAKLLAALAADIKKGERFTVKV